VVQDLPEPVLPPPLAPMTAKAVTSLPAGDGWAFEPKFDGYRALTFRTTSSAGAPQVVVQSRQQRMLTAHFPDVAAAVAGLDVDAVLDGEVVIWRAGRLDFGALQDRLRSGPARARNLALELPAAYVVFDLLAVDHTDLRDQPYRHRRQALEELLGRRLPPGLVLAPTSTDPAVARAWLLGHTTSGVEGVVAKRVDQPYRPGVRGWQKLRTRLTAEAVVGGVIGPLHAPEVLLLGRPDAHGQLHLAGRTTEISPTASVAVAAALTPQIGPGHPWPEVLPSTRWGRPGPPTVYNQVRPELVAEVVVDTAVEQHRWRHPARFVRLRLDLRPADLYPAHLHATSCPTDDAFGAAGAS
jgi:ATP-dependent DNA ligase